MGVSGDAEGGERKLAVIPDFMQINKQSIFGFNSTVFEKVEKYQPIFEDGLSSYFKTKEFGDSVSEISYKEFLIHDNFPSGETHKIAYMQEERRIVCIIQPEYKKIRKCSSKTYEKLLVKEYLEMSNRFSELNIANFDVNKYVEYLKDFFKQHQLL